MLRRCEWRASMPSPDANRVRIIGGEELLECPQDPLPERLKMLVELFRLNGWQRIGIVLSGLWAIGSWLYVEDAAIKAAYETKSAYYDICTRQKEERNDWDAKPCFDHAKGLYQTRYSDTSAWALPV